MHGVCLVDIDKIRRDQAQSDRPWNAALQLNNCMFSVKFTLFARDATGLKSCTCRHIIILGASLQGSWLQRIVHRPLEGHKTLWLYNSGAKEQRELLTYQTPITKTKEVTCRTVSPVLLKGVWITHQCLKSFHVLSKQISGFSHAALKILISLTLANELWTFTLGTKACPPPHVHHCVHLNLF